MPERTHRGWLVTAALMAVVVMAAPAALAQAGTASGSLSDKTRTLYLALTGQDPGTTPELRDMGLRDKIDRATQMLYGDNWQGRVSESLLGRVDQLVSLVRWGDPNTSLLSRELAVEWAVNQWVYEYRLGSEKKPLQVPNDWPVRPLRERVAWMEGVLYGQEQAGGLVDRVDRLARDVWGGDGKVRTKSVKITQNAGSVQVMLLGALSNAEGSASRVRDTVQFMVVEDLRLEGALIVPAGTIGVAEVTEVESPGLLGRPGKLTVSAQIRSLDGVLLSAGLRLDQPGTGSSSASLPAVSGPGGVPSGLLVGGEARRFSAGDRLKAVIGPGAGWKEFPAMDAIIVGSGA